MVKKGFIIRALLSLFLLNSLLAQEPVNDEKSFYQANLLTLYDKYDEALPVYLKLLDKYPDNSNLQYLTGVCYLHIPGQKARAIPYLEKASQHVSVKYKKELYSETRAPLETILFLGNAYQITNQLDKALTTYSRYKKLLHKKQSKEIVNHRIQSCKLAKKMMNNPRDAEVIFPELLKIGPVIYHPAISGDGKKMVFMGDTRFYHAIYFTKSEHGAWTTPNNITMDLESDGSYQVSSLNQDGTLLFLIVPHQGNKDIFISKYRENHWGKAVLLKGKVNTLHNEVFASLSPDGHQLYFVSDRGGGPGGLDIFTATLSSEGNWDNIKPLPAPVNTPYDEQSPILTDGGNKLFFSSNDHATMGGYDIFVSDVKNGTWQNPVNLGYPPNTTDDDLYFAPLHNGYQGFITRYLNEKDKKSNIASVEFFSPEHPRPLSLTGKLILPREKELPPDLNIEITNGSGKVLSITKNEVTKEGLFDMHLPAGTYSVSITGKGIKPYAGVIKMGKEKPLERIAIHLILANPKKIIKTKTYLISPAYFDFNKYTLTATSRGTLDKVVSVLQELPEVKVTISGHTDDIGSNTYNQELSLKRALSVKDYLISRGITSSRLSVIGYGETRPIAINKNTDGTDNPKGRQLNRRAEFHMKGNQADQIHLEQNIPPELAIHK